MRQRLADREKEALQARRARLKAAMAAQAQSPYSVEASKRFIAKTLELAKVQAARDAHLAAEEEAYEQRRRHRRPRLRRR